MKYLDFVPYDVMETETMCKYQAVGKEPETGRVVCLDLFCH